MTMDAKKSISPAETLASPANSVPDHPPTPPAASWKHLFAFTRWPTHLPTFLIAVAASLAVAGLKTALSVVLGRVFDVIAGFGSRRLQDDQTMAQIAHWCMVLTALGAGTWLANSLFLAAWAVFGELQGFSARHSVFANLANKDMAWFDAQTEGVSSLLVQIETQTRELQLASSQILGFLITDVFCSLASLVLALYFSWKLALVLLATLPVSWVVMSLATRKLEPAILAQKAQLARASKHAIASVTAIDLVKVFSGEDQEVWQYLQAIRLAATPYLVQARANAVQMGYLACWIILLFVVGFWYGVALVNEGKWSPGAMLTTFYAILNAFQSIEAFMPQWLVISKGMAAGRTLGNFCQQRPQEAKRLIHRLAGLQSPAQVVGDIELEDVSFAYPSNPHELALQPSSFSFPSGATTFIVGQSGSGKSTIANLLVRFYAPRSGAIFLDNIPIETLDTYWLRTNVTLIQQSSVLFDDTFFSNVALGHSGNPADATREEVMAACDAALLQATLAAMPNGLDTTIGPRGHALSGGQMQRLALARARLGNPPVLVLDEITSGLDQVSRLLIMEALRVWRRGKTTIIITHDVSQIQASDFVYVMDRGVVVQAGLRAELSRDEMGYFMSLVEAGDGGVEEPKPEIIEPMEMEAAPPAPNTVMRRISKLIREGWQSPMSPTDATTRNRASLGFSMAAPYSATINTHRPWNSPTTADEVPKTPALLSPPARRPSTRDPPDARLNRQTSLVRKYSIDAVQAAGASTQASRMAPTPRRRKVSSMAFVEPCQDSEVASLKSSDSRPPRQTGLGEIFGTVWPNLSSKERMALLAGVLCSVVVGACNPTFSLCFSKLMSAMWLPGDEKLAEGQMWALILFGIAIADGIATFLSHYLLEYAALAWVDTLRVEALRRILHQPHFWFHDSHIQNSPQKIGEVVDRDAEEMRNIVGRFLPIVVVVLVILSASLVWAMIVSWKLTLVALASGPIVALSLKSFSFINMRWESQCGAAAAAASAVVTETFLNVRVVRALTVETIFARKHAAAATATYKLGMKKAAFSGPLYGLYQSMNYFLIALVFYYGTVMLTVNHEIAVGNIVQVINLLLFSIGSASSALSTMPQISAARATAAQMLAYARLPVDGDQGDATDGELDLSRRPSGLADAERLVTPLPVRMRNLVFAYPSRRQNTVLRGINLDITGGTMTALVGPSGCGKSTVTSLLLGLQRPPLTTNINAPPPLTFAGYSPSDIDTTIMRTKLALVPQQPFLFPDSVMENILYALPESSPLRTEENARQAARAVGLDDFFSSLPEGYRSLLGEGGMALSGGQAQRVNIARALARQPLLLVMDEPTSALDGESAEAIRQTISDLMREASSQPRETPLASPASLQQEFIKNGIPLAQDADDASMKMAIVIATHSREMMKLADRVVMLQDGYVVEEGGYRELVERRGRFAALVSGGEWHDDGDGGMHVATGWRTEDVSGWRDVSF